MSGPVRDLLLASRNAGKAREVARVLADLPLRLVLPDELGGLPEVEETGETFRDNARAKALALARASGLWALADDSGLEVDALDGRPGVRSARFAGPGAGDGENLARLLEEMAAVPEEKRAARFRCHLAVASPAGIAVEATGACEGRIVAAPAGNNGFGYDPVFVPVGEERTMAQLSAEEKDAISHRGRALRELKPRLAAWLDKAGK